MNILFTCAGRRISLIESFRRALSDQRLTGSIIGTDSSPLSAALNVCDYRYVIPKSDDPSYIDPLLSICDDHDVSLVIPLTDFDLVCLAESREMFSSAGVVVLVSTLPMVRLCYDKRLTSAFFQKHKVPIPAEFTIEDLETDTVTYPLFIKPAKGSGSLDSYKIGNAEELRHALDIVSDPIIQEFLTGQEYTIDCLLDFEGRIINVAPRRRLEVRAGESTKGVMVKNWQIIDQAVDMLEKLKAIGPVTVQCFFDGEQIRFTEINPRFGGGVPLTISAGADYPAQLIRMMREERVSPCIGDFEDDFYMFRYEDAVYLPGKVVHSVPNRGCV